MTLFTQYFKIANNCSSICPACCETSWGLYAPSFGASGPIYDTDGYWLLNITEDSDIKVECEGNHYITVLDVHFCHLSNYYITITNVIGIIVF